MGVKMFSSEKDIAEYYGTDNVAKAVYDSTECGCTYTSSENSVSVAGYAEGAWCDCPTHTLFFPFTSDDWEGMLAEADAEGCELWEEVNFLCSEKFEAVKEKLTQMMAEGWEIPKLVACVYDLFQAYIISERQEII